METWWSGFVHPWC